MRISVLGIDFDALTLSEATEAADALCRAGQGGSIVTANPELLLRVRKDESLRDRINGAELVLADGVGVLYAARILGTPLPERVTGSDLTPRLLEKLAVREGRVFLYGGKPGVAERAAAAIETAYPGLRVVGTENGYISDETALLTALAETRPELILLGLGAPKQERWMAAHRGEQNAVMIGVGGMLDVFAGDVTRAPECWQRANAEWLYRLLRQPERLPRMIRLPGVLLLAAGERVKHGKTKNTDARR